MDIFKALDVFSQKLAWDPPPPPKQVQEHPQMGSVVSFLPSFSMVSLIPMSASSLPILSGNKQWQGLFSEISNRIYL